MKKLIKWMLILSAVFCLLGIGVITAGAMMDGGYYLGQALRAADRWDGRWEEWHKDQRLCQEEGLEAIEYMDKTPLLEPGSQELPLTKVNVYEGIRELEADIAGMVIFRESEELSDGQVRILRGDDGEDYEYRQEGDTLKITYPEKRKRDGLSFRNTVTVQVPAKSPLKEIEIEVNAGECLAEAMEAEEISLQVNAGQIEVKKGKADRLELEADAGQILCRADVTEKVSAECGLGEILLTLKGGREDFDYELECSAGMISLGGPEPKEYVGLNQKTKIGHEAGKKAELECAMGSIVVDYFDGQ